MAPADSLEAHATRLLAATEALHRALDPDGPTDALRAAWHDRVTAFEAFRDAIEAGDPVGPSVRACIDRVRELDAELIGEGARLVSAIRSERHGLDRRRAAIQAHGSRERPEPRAVIVKA